jgi:hypothetical protein
MFSTCLRRTANSRLLHTPFRQPTATPRILAQPFRTSPHRPVHPLFWIILRPVAKIGAVLTGRWVTTSHDYFLPCVLQL